MFDPLQIYRIGLGWSLLFLSLSTFCALRPRPPCVLVLLRWLRWLTISFLTAFSMKLFLTPGAPILLLLFTGFVLWFLFESFLLWRTIGRLQNLDVPFLLPLLTLESQDFLRPVQKKMLQQFLKKENFLFETFLKSEYQSHLWELFSVYYSPRLRTRLVLNFHFAPLPNQRETATFISVTEKKNVIISENSMGAFGGYYPANWHVKRLPLKSNRALFHYHLNRIRNKNLIDFQNENELQLPALQNELRDFNRDRNFFQKTDNGLYLSNEACYRIWKEAFFLRYFGRPLK